MMTEYCVCVCGKSFDKRLGVGAKAQNGADLLLCSMHCVHCVRYSEPTMAAPPRATKHDQMVAAGYPVKLTAGPLRGTDKAEWSIHGGRLGNIVYTFGVHGSPDRLYDMAIGVNVIDWEHYWFHRGGPKAQAAWAEKHPPKKLIDGELMQIDGHRCRVIAMQLHVSDVSGVEVYGGSVQETWQSREWRGTEDLCSPRDINWARYYLVRADTWANMNGAMVGPTGCAGPSTPPASKPLSHRFSNEDFEWFRNICLSYGLTAYVCEDNGCAATNETKSARWDTTLRNRDESGLRWTLENRGFARKTLGVLKNGDIVGGQAIDLFGKPIDIPDADDWQSWQQRNPSHDAQTVRSIYEGTYRDFWSDHEQAYDYFLQRVASGLWQHGDRHSQIVQQACLRATDTKKDPYRGK